MSSSIYSPRSTQVGRLLSICTDPLLPKAKYLVDQVYLFYCFHVDLLELAPIAIGRPLLHEIHQHLQILWRCDTHSLKVKASEVRE